MLKSRVFSAVILIIVFGAGIITGGLLWWALLLFISIIGLSEYYRAIRRIPEGEKHTPDLPEILGYLAAVLYFILIRFFPAERNFLFFIAGLIIIFMAAYVISFPKYESRDIMCICFGFFYIPFMLSFMYLLRMMDRGAILILLVFISAWICDTFAYLTGVAFGKHKLAPVLSPKKSVEGSVGGVLASVLIGGLLAFFVKGSIPAYACITGIGAVISQFGDLFASGIKRDLNIKDYGHLIPGHGGILDRFDSLIIVAPVMYVFFSLFLK